MRPKMNSIDASTQSPVETSTSSPVARMPIPANSARNRFLPRLMSEMVPRIGERMATSSSEMLRPRLHRPVAAASLGRVAPATWL